MGTGGDLGSTQLQREEKAFPFTGWNPNPLPPPHAGAPSSAGGGVLHDTTLPSLPQQSQLARAVTTCLTEEFREEAGHTRLHWELGLEPLTLRLLPLSPLLPPCFFLTSPTSLSVKRQHRPVDQPGARKDGVSQSTQSGPLALLRHFPNPQPKN